jgi:cysteinyl-tRNA synthetase
VLRLNMLKTQYRSPIDWTMKSLEESARTLDDWYRVAADVAPAPPATSVVEPLLDDLNTPLAIAALHGLRGSDAGALAGSLRLLGFLSESAAQWEGRKQRASGVDAAEVERLIAERTAARARKDFAESDRIRDLLAAMGVAIKDSKDGTTWEFSR